MKNKGFTLIELISVIALIAIIAVIATPNIIKMIDSSKRETFVTNAKTMISNAKYRNKLAKYDDLFEISSGCRIISAENLEVDFDTDPDGNTYDLNNSKVKVCLENNTYIYYVKTVPTGNIGRGVYSLINNENYVNESELTNDSVINVS